MIRKGIYRHYKGGLYKVIDIASHTEEDYDLIIYKSIKGFLWARPYEMFFDAVEYEGDVVPRFQYVGNFGDGE